MFPEENITNKENVEDSRPSKKNITVTMIFAVLLAFAFIALGMWWFTNQRICYMKIGISYNRPSGGFT